MSEHILTGPMDARRRGAMQRSVAMSMYADFDCLPGRGIVRADRLTLWGEFILQASSAMAGPRGVGPEKTAEALRRLADRIQRGDL